MTKRISTKYTLSVTAVIIIITLIFIPVYIIVQKTVYIHLQKKHIILFYENLVSSVDLSDSDDIAKFFNKDGTHSYRTLIYNEKKKRIFSTDYFRKKEEKMDKRPIPEEHLDDYSENNLPVYYEHENNRAKITLRRICHTQNTSYYIYIQESLQNIESIFFYTNQFLVLILIIYIFVCMISLFFAMRQITKSVYKLTDVVKRFADKDYSVRFEDPIPSDEIGSLANNFNNMADIIQSNFYSIDNYNFLLKEDLNHLKEYENLRRKFVRNTTHELKTPLAIISSNVEMMSYTKDENKRKYYYDSVMEEIQKMSSLITSFLKYSSNESQTLQASFENINLSEAVEHLCDKITSTLQSKKITFIRNVEASLFSTVSPIHVEHIFNNFIMNAISHTSPNGCIIVSLQEIDSRYRFSVYNDGKPIPENQLPIIWNEFYTVGSKSSANAGLGLFIVKEISALNHTECGIENQEHGVEFWFDFLPFDTFD